MDTRLEKALDFSNYRMILNTRQENLKTLMENKLVLSYEGGLFKINQSLLSFIYTLLSQGIEEYIFIDQNDSPILISDVNAFYQKAKEKYESTIKQYFSSFQKLNEARNIRKVIDWENER